MEEILKVKIKALSIVFISALIPGLVPMKLRQVLVNSKSLSAEATSIILSCSLCCGAGILMATIFLHILKEARYGLASLGEYSYAELTMCLGFFLIYLVEELTLLWVSFRSTMDDDEANAFKRTYSTHRLSVSRMISTNSNASPTCIALEIQDKSNNFAPNINLSGKSSSCNSHNSNTLTASEAVVALTQYPPLQSRIEDELTDRKSPNISLVRSLIVISALSLHGALEGLALGLEDKVPSVWLLCLALSFHKIFIGFSIGMEMMEEGTSSLLYVIHILLFSLASPIGGSVGITLVNNLETNSPNAQIITGVLQGASAGAILYVVFCEVLERERGKNNYRLLQFLSVAVGFAIIAVLGVTLGHDHNHGNHEQHPYQHETSDHQHGGHAHVYLDFMNNTLTHNKTELIYHNIDSHTQQHDHAHQDHNDHSELEIGNKNQLPLTIYNSSIVENEENLDQELLATENTQINKDQNHHGDHGSHLHE